jgi:hypothetical protein
MKRNAMYVFMGVIVCVAGTMVAENAVTADGKDAFYSLAATVKCFPSMFSTDGSWTVVSRSINAYTYTTENSMSKEIGRRREL